MRSYAKVNSQQAHADTQRPEPARQPPEVERRINAGYYRLLWAILTTPLPRKGRGARGERPNPKSEVRVPKFKAQRSPARHPAAMDYLSQFLCLGFVLALMASGCASRPLKGGKAVITRKPAGVIEQTLVQSENPSQAAKQDQESVKVRTYTVPAGSRIQQSLTPGTVAPRTASASHDSQRVFLL